jgi:hypothetical protein
MIPGAGEKQGKTRSVDPTLWLKKRKWSVWTGCTEEEDAEV